MGNEELIERLEKLAKCYALYTDEQDMVREAIAALSSQSPRLPVGWSILRHDDGSITLRKDADGGFSLRYSDHLDTSSREDLAFQFLSAFLPTPIEDSGVSSAVQDTGETLEQAYRKRVNPNPWSYETDTLWLIRELDRRKAAG